MNTTTSRPVPANHTCAWNHEQLCACRMNTEVAAEENWVEAHGRYPETDEEYAELNMWIEVLWEGNIEGDENLCGHCSMDHTLYED
jgi:hypothetical protein